MQRINKEGNKSMIRQKIEELYDWKQRKKRKPLVIQGARQVGKTWLMKTFAEEAFPQYIYINFEETPALRSLFEKDFDMKRILFEIYLATGKQVEDETLLILDEIQEAPRGITALKYFCEKMPHLPVMAAGSLLGIASHQHDSFPVGKVDFINLYPLSFFEFVDAMGQEHLLEPLRMQQWDATQTVASRLESLLRQYYYVGGMPEVVQSFADNGDLKEVRRLQQAILDSYDRDFSKHAPIEEVPRLRMVWNSVSGQLSKENKKFIYGFIKAGARAKNFELAIEWLRDAGLLYKVNRAKKGQMPLSAYEDFAAFKVFLLDVGLLASMCGLSTNALLAESTLFSDYRGALTEQYVFQQLKLSKENSIYYWSADNSRGEIDFLMQHDGKIIPIEVKAEDNLQSKSLRMFIEANQGLHGVRFSMAPYREQSWMTNYPLYAIEAVL